MTGRIAARLAELGLTLPEAPPESEMAARNADLICAKRAPAGR